VNKIRCSFCGKAHDDVAALVSGPVPVLICNECHTLMAPIMARAPPPAPERAVVQGPWKTRL
jgi:ATP-dependent protease Clp ATPase subunit